MSASAALKHSSRPLPAVLPTPQQTESSETAARPEAAASASILATAYTFIHRLGQRWRSFGSKFRLTSRTPHSNWVKRKSPKSIAELRKMY